jgi:hypothetical protein
MWASTTLEIESICGELVDFGLVARRFGVGCRIADADSGTKTFRLFGYKLEKQHKPTTYCEIQPIT